MDICETTISCHSLQKEIRTRITSLIYFTAKHLHYNGPLNGVKKYMAFYSIARQCGVNYFSGTVQKFFARIKNRTVIYQASNTSKSVLAEHSWKIIRKSKLKYALFVHKNTVFAYSFKMRHYLFFQKLIAIQTSLCCIEKIQASSAAMSIDFCTHGILSCQSETPRSVLGSLTALAQSAIFLPYLFEALCPHNYLH